MTDEIRLWEAAYSRFETPEEELRKFSRRLISLGASGWSRDAEIVELFCGRGNGLESLARLGFRHIEGADLSPTLAAQYRGPAKIHVCDCRQLPFSDQSKDILIVQGGLHHLTILPDDLEQVLAESRRVLRKEGRLVIVEPWQTPFLRFVHAVCRNRMACRLSGKLNALATMIQYERTTYEQWLSRPDSVRKILDREFEPQYLSIRWGKLFFIGTPR